jgi:hypothetical protein
MFLLSTFLLSVKVGRIGFDVQHIRHVCSLKDFNGLIVVVIEDEGVEVVDDS